MTIKKYILYSFLYVYRDLPNFNVLSVIVIKGFWFTLILDGVFLSAWF